MDREERGEWYGRPGKVRLLARVLDHFYPPAVIRGRGLSALKGRDRDTGQLLLEACEVAKCNLRLAPAEQLTGGPGWHDYAG